MVSAGNWKIDENAAKIEIVERLCENTYFTKLEDTISKNKNAFVQEKYVWLDRDFADKGLILKESKAREKLTDLLMNYLKVCQMEFASAPEKELNQFLLLNNTLKKIADDTQEAISKIFYFDVGKWTLRKKKGETAEHYLLKCIIADFLNKTYKIKELEEEHSKLKEVLQSLKNGTATQNEWKKIAKRADLYIVLEDGKRFWVEVERSFNSESIKKKVKKLKLMLSQFPDLFDKVVVVSSSCYLAALGYLQEAKEVRFPEDKFDFYGVDLQKGEVQHVENARLVKTKFGDILLDIIAGGGSCKGKTAQSAKDTIERDVILPLFNGKISKKKVQRDLVEYKNLIRFWRRRISKMLSNEGEIERKKELLMKVKQNYPFLIK
jgi:hypothetical protein